jgi:hypothetical protein
MMLPREPNKSFHLWPFCFILYVPEVSLAEDSSQPPAEILDSQQRGGFREAYGDPPRCSRLQGAGMGVWNRAYLESFRKRKLSIGGLTASHFENRPLP